MRRTKPNDRLRSLAGLPLFAKLPPESLRLLAQTVVRKQLQTGEMVFSEGQTCKGLYLIDSGVVKLFKASKDGREQVVSTHGPGDSLSELSIIDGGTRRSTPQCT